MVRLKADVAGFSLTASARYHGDKKAPWSDEEKARKLPTNFNRHVVTIAYQKKRLRFDFWASIASPEIREPREIKSAIVCFLDDAAAGRLEYREFCDEFGYNEDSRRVERIWKACRESKKRADRVLPERLQEKIRCEWE